MRQLAKVLYDRILFNLSGGGGGGGDWRGEGLKRVKHLC